jgi:hypothetical protein
VDPPPGRTPVLTAAVVIGGVAVELDGSAVAVAVIFGPPASPRPARSFWPGTELNASRPAQTVVDFGVFGGDSDG